jgi:hypothetical protein
MKALLRMYPRAWRERYGDEFLALLASEPQTPRLVLDVLAGALDARLNARLGTRVAKPAAVASRGLALIGGLSFRCGAAPRQTRAEMLVSSLVLAGLMVGLTALYVAMRHTYGSALWVEALGFAALPLSLAVWAAQIQWKGTSWAARTVLFLIVVTLAFFGAWLDRSF